MSHVGPHDVRMSDNATPGPPQDPLRGGDPVLVCLNPDHMIGGQLLAPPAPDGKAVVRVTCGTADGSGTVDFTVSNLPRGALAGPFPCAADFGTPPSALIMFGPGLSEVRGALRRIVVDPSYAEGGTQELLTLEPDAPAQLPPGCTRHTVSVYRGVPGVQLTGPFPCWMPHPGSPRPFTADDFLALTSPPSPPSP